MAQASGLGDALGSGAADDGGTLGATDALGEAPVPAVHAAARIDTRARTANVELLRMLGSPKPGLKRTRESVPGQSIRVR